MIAINEEGREVVLAGCPNQDILINNAGGPPPGDFPQVTREDRIRAIDANMLTPVFLIRAVVAGMVARGFGRIINITTMGVKSPRTYPQLGVSDRRPVRTDRRFRRVPLQCSGRLSDGSKYLSLMVGRTRGLPDNRGRLANELGSARAGLLLVLPRDLP